MITIDCNVINFSLFLLLMSIKAWPIKDNVLAGFKIAFKILPELHNIFPVFIGYVSGCWNIICFLTQTIKECTNWENLNFLG